MQVSTYRCFLPDLTGFIDLHCIGPGPTGSQQSDLSWIGRMNRNNRNARKNQGFYRRVRGVRCGHL